MNRMRKVVLWFVAGAVASAMTVSAVFAEEDGVTRSDVKTVTLATPDNIREHFDDLVWLDTGIVDPCWKAVNPSLRPIRYANDVVILVVAVEVTSGKATKVQRDYRILHKPDGWKFSKYLLGSKRVIIVSIAKDDLTAKGYEFEVTREKSAFAKSLESLPALILSATGAPPLFMEKADNQWQCQVIELDKSMIDDPCVLKITEKKYFSSGEPWSAEVKFHERNIAIVQIGVAGFGLDRKNFKIEDGQFTVTVDSTDKKEFSNSLYLGLNLHLPRDIDRYHSFIYWDNGIKFNPALNLFGVLPGVKLSSNPFDAFFVGLTFDLLPGIGLVGGWSANKVVKESTEDVGTITDLGEAKQSAPTKYELALFGGITVSPAQIVKALGLD